MHRYQKPSWIVFNGIDTYNLQKGCNGTTWSISVYGFIFISLI